ncbi:hypothetical protein RO3G_10015 [Rhizopus delemar RA 99-880]|uniref:SGNH hydrolase-type esterase domain-containing protein n=1 Tax=Rhizopus delemar (strain RA 99-880 / ATCC MYA-4621 / FGSC 9543 / NRRL 43880) TaxID=246409 RepID=I1CA25_RHIO9|nr:hypothetical protein RO3G_10015 [Rhizopus delemar RA 99-880]|eukprot:EIE85305.1 hypothetical protein RO3G_10015 [Rhizopus delemar RA 99-880]
MLILGLLFLLLSALTSSAQSYRFEDINTIISFGDSYTTRYIDLSNLTYACRNCTSAGAPNWVVYIEDDTDWVSWDFAASGAPLNNALVHKIQELYLGVFAAPSATIEDIVQSAYKNGPRTAHSTLNTIWIGINDIGLTFGWDNTTAIDKEIMIRYESLIVCLKKVYMSTDMGF